MDSRVRYDPAEFHPPRCQECQNGSFNSQYNWDFIPLGVCISLKERNDRTEEATKQFHRVGLCKKVLFYRPEKDKSPIHRPGTRGCWESHRRVARLAKESGLDKVLIFEDDVLFDKNITPENVKLAGEGMTSLGRDWNGYFLGHWPIFARPTRKKGVLRSWALAMHAYVANEPLIDWMLAHPFDKTLFRKMGGFGIDCYVAVKPKMYAAFPMLAYQSGSVTSNPKPKVGGSILDFLLSDPKYMKFSQHLGLGTYYLATLLLIIFVVVLLSKFCKKK